MTRADETTRPRYVISHERYGATSVFDTLESAQAALRACGDDFEGVTLSVIPNGIVDETGEVIGYVEEPPR